MTPEMVEHMARRLMRKHKIGMLWRVKCIPEDPIFYGLCERHTFTIIINSFYLNIVNQTHVKETILHEIAHVKVSARDKGGAHGPLWEECYNNLLRNK